MLRCACSIPQISAQRALSLYPKIVLEPLTALRDPVLCMLLWESQLFPLAMRGLFAFATPNILILCLTIIYAVFLLLAIIITLGTLGIQVRL